METRGRTTRRGASQDRSPSAPVTSQHGENQDAQQEQTLPIQEELLVNTLADFRSEVRSEVQQISNSISGELRATMRQDIRQNIETMLPQLVASILAQLNAETALPGARARTPPTDTPQPHTAAQTQEMRFSEPPSTITHGTILRTGDFPKFTADNTEVDSWIEQVNAIFQYSGAEEAQLLKLLPLLLEGQALEWFTGLRQQRYQYRNWADWQNALRTAFRAPNYEETLRLKLVRRRLRDNESFNLYFQDKLQLIYKVYGDAIPLNTIMEELISGFPSTMHSEIRGATREVRLLHGNIEDFRREVLNLEYGIRSRIKGFNAFKDNVFASDASIVRRDRPIMNGHRLSNQARPRITNDQQRTQRQDIPIVHPRPPPVNVSINAPAAPPSVAICYNCGKTGHYSKDCRSPRAARPQAQQNNWRSPATNTNSVDMPYNRYEDKELDPSVNIITTRSKGKPAVKNTASTPIQVRSDNHTDAKRTPSPEPQKETPSATDAAQDLTVIRLEAKKDKGRINVPHHYDKMPATTVIRLNEQLDLHKACIDSGSSISLIDAQYLKKWCPDIEPQPCSNFVINSLGAGSQAWSFADINTSFKGANKYVIIKVRFYISPFAHTKIIIGNDVLDTYSAILDFKTHLFYFAECPEEQFPMKAEQQVPEQFRSAAIRSKDAYAIRPNTIANIAVQAINSAPGATYIIQDCKNAEGQQAGILPGILCASNNCIVQFMNNGTTTLNISAEEIIGTAAPIQAQPPASNKTWTDEKVTPEVMEDCKIFTQSVEELSIFGTDLTINQKERILDVLLQNRKAFAYGSRTIGKTDWVTFSVETDGATPISQPPYHASPAGRKVIEETIAELLEDEIIEPCNSPWGSPVVLVKQGAKVRFCVDYRKLNSVTKKDQWPIPRIDDILAAFTGKKFFSTFDANKGFHQISIASEQDMDKLAFRTHQGQHRFKRMPFGVTNGPSAFQRLSDQILGSSKWDFALVYIDDIIVFSETFEDHLVHIDHILKRVIKSGITLSLGKSHCAKSTIQALGHTISNLGIGTAPHNMEAIAHFPTPTNLKALQRFIGMAVYYRKFIPDFAKIARPLHQLCKKDAKYEWTQAHQDAFDKLKTMLSSEPVLAHPNFSKPFILHTDASTLGLGAILSQTGDDMHEHPICCVSRTLAPAEVNYSATELECLAVVWALKKLHAFLDGANFELITDHSALQWLHSFKGNNRRLNKWMLELQHFKNFMKITYRPGRIHSNVDPLSRAPLPHQENDDIEATSNTLYTMPTVTSLTVTTNAEPQVDQLSSQLPQLYQEDKFFEPIWNALHKQEPLPPHLQGFFLRNNLIWRKAANGNQMCIAANSSIRLQLLQDYHDAPLSAHLGQLKTLTRLASSYWWPTMVQDTKDYVQSCASCQRNKASNAAAPGLLQPIESPPHRWHTIAMDFTGPLPITKSGFDMLMVITDKFSKRMHLVPVHSTDKAPDTAQHFFKNVVRLHGLPYVIISDRDAKFTSLFWKTLFQSMGTKLAMSTAFHPQTDGQTERLNRTIKEMMRHYISHSQTDWDQHLDALEFAYNDSIHASTGFTPFELDTGFHPRSPLRQEPIMQTQTPIGMQDFADNLWFNAQLAHQAITHAQRTQAHYYNKHHRFQVFNPGDMVYLSMKHVNPYWLQGRPSKKLNPKYIGPYKILAKVSDTSYTLELPPDVKIHPTINIQYLKAACASPTQFVERNQLPPQPINISGEPEYFIECIEAHRVRRRRLEFLVKWLGYEQHDNTWLPATELAETSALEQYLQVHQELAPTSNHASTSAIPPMALATRLNSNLISTTTLAQPTQIQLTNFKS